MNKLILILPALLILSMTIQSVKADNATATTTKDYTKLFSGKDFQFCSPGCIAPIQTVKVFYQGPLMLVLKSSFIDEIWKGVEIAKEDGYKIDGISTYVTSSGSGGTVNTLVAMSKETKLSSQQLAETKELLQEIAKNATTTSTMKDNLANTSKLLEMIAPK